MSFYPDKVVHTTLSIDERVVLRKALHWHSHNRNVHIEERKRAAALLRLLEDCIAFNVEYYAKD